MDGLLDNVYNVDNDNDDTEGININNSNDREGMTHNDLSNNISNSNAMTMNMNRMMMMQDMNMQPYQMQMNTSQYSTLQSGEGWRSNATIDCETRTIFGLASLLTPPSLISGHQPHPSLSLSTQTPDIQTLHQTSRNHDGTTR